MFVHKLYLKHKSYKTYNKDEKEDEENGGVW
jgi:hypothetical protein